MERASRLLALTLLLPLLTWAQVGAADGPPAPVAETARASGLGAALDAISERRIEADIHFIASDQLAGRDTPSDGLRVAARYIRARLMSLGIEPGARDGSYFHEYELATTAMDREQTRVELEGGREPVRFDIGEGYHLDARGVRSDAELRGRVVFLGSEARDLELGPDALEGAWALVHDQGGPTGGLRLLAQRLGALGLILTPGPDYEEAPYEERFTDRLAALERGSVMLPRAEGEASVGRRPSPRLFLPRESFLRLLEVAPVRPDDVPATEWSPEPGTDLGLELVEHRTLSGGGRVVVENVCGFWPGSDPVLAAETIIVSAHYDHVGTTGDDIFNGADDNGSGTCGLMAVAEALSVHGPLRRSVLLIWVSGEEKGLLGSRAWSDDPWLPGDARPVANLNIDMIGRNDPQQILLTPTAAHEKHNGIMRMIEERAHLEGFIDIGDADAYFHRSDQASFARLGIPVAFLFTDVHQDYHRPTDVPEKIDTDKIRRVSRLVVRLLDAMQTDTLEL